MKMKKVLALVATGIMAFGLCMVVSAEDSTPASASGNSASGNSVASTSEEAAGAAETYDAGTEAFALEIEATGVSQTTYFAAAEEGKSIAEYISNSVTEVPGLEEATPVGQGGKVILDGKVSNVNFSVQKPVLAQVNSAKAQAAALGGDVLNVVKIQSTTTFGTASVNFYMPGVTADQKIQVYQYVDKEWVSVDVAEVRADHVVVDMTSLGVFAFIQVQ